MNPHKGEVELKVGDKIYTLRYSVDALCRLEAATGKGFPVLAGEMGDPERMTITLVRQVLWAGISCDGRSLMLEEAGELIPLAGGLVPVMTKVSEALSLAFPEARGTAGPTKGARVRAGSGGTGRFS